MERYYTVEQVAELLTMHPKTIQRYIREDKLKAKKVGKSWRIDEQDLREYMKSSDVDGGNLLKPENKALASSVIDIKVINREEASDIEKYLVAAMNSKPEEFGETTMHIQYLEHEKKLRVALWGNILFMQKIFELLYVVIEEN